MSNASVWLQALRSGQYKQADSALAVPDGEEGFRYCCLGVACEVAIDAGVTINKIVDQEGGVTYDYEAGTLPDKAKNWLEFSSANPQIIIDNIHYDPNGAYGYTLGRRDNPSFLVNDDLASLNDYAGLTFEQIADLVEYVGPESL